MSDYDFSALNDKEFEILCADLLGVALNRRFERFKPGRDSGVDGRFFTQGGKETVLQCKHWPNTPIEQLVSKLRTDEVPKVHKLRPERYLLAISNPLSRRDKTALVQMFAPYIKSEDDIFGREDLNDLLRSNEIVERRHFKLWLSSTHVLTRILNRGIYDRSDFAYHEMLEDSRRYAKTRAHDQAYEIAEKHGVVIITGEPGIGKTMLAEQLCLNYVADGFSLIKMSDSIREAEDVFDKSEKQIFYFDDFLGRNYLDALSGHEGSNIVLFIQRLRSSKDKRFILTSRSTILNHGKLLIDSFHHGKIDRNEYVLTVSALSEMDKAHILYNHIWFSALQQEFIEQLYVDKRYKLIIRHQNYNPRLIRFITDRERFVDCPPDRYWDAVQASLENPADVWDHPFVAQLDDFGRAIVLLITINSRAISQDDLSMAFARFVTLMPAPRGNLDFLSTLRQLTGSLISRQLASHSQAQINLFNPSIGDYVLRRFSQDANSLTCAVMSLRSTQSLNTLQALKRDEMLTPEAFSSIVWKLATVAQHESFVGYDEDYLSLVMWLFVSTAVESQTTRACTEAALKALIDGHIPNDCSALAQLYKWGTDRSLIEPRLVLQFIGAASPQPRDRAELEEMACLLGGISPQEDDYAEAMDIFKSSVMYCLSDSLNDSVSDADIIQEVEYGDYRELRSRVRSHIEGLLERFVCVEFDYSDVTQILDVYDAESELHNFYTNNSEPDSSRHGYASYTQPIDDIDDLFERS